MWLIKTIDFLSFVVAFALLGCAAYYGDLGLLWIALAVLVTIQALMILARIYLGYKSSIPEIISYFMAWWP